MLRGVAQNESKRILTESRTLSAVRGGRAAPDTEPDFHSALQSRIKTDSYAKEEKQDRLPSRLTCKENECLTIKLRPREQSSRQRSHIEQIHRKKRQHK
jgi:hypothetical protein